MRCLRPSLIIALFAGSVTALGCGGGDDDDGSMNTTVSDAAAVATGAATPGAFDAGTQPALPALPFDASSLTGLLDSAVVTGLLDSAVVTGFVDGLYDSGVITTTDAGGVGFDPGAACRAFPTFCRDGALSLPSGFPGSGGNPGGGTPQP